MKKLGRRWLLAIVALTGTLALAGGAAAGVTFNPDGTGFVGKGDIQTAFGWNNAQFQANVGRVTFTYAETFSIASESCSHWVDGSVVGSWSRDSVGFDPAWNEGFQLRRQRGGKVTGFTLTGPVGDAFDFVYFTAPPLPLECYQGTRCVFVEVGPEQDDCWSYDSLGSDPNPGLTFLFANYGGQMVPLARFENGTG